MSYYTNPNLPSYLQDHDLPNRQMQLELLQQQVMQQQHNHVLQEENRLASNKLALNIAQLIHTRINQLGLNQDQLANFCGLNLNEVMAIETGNFSQISADKLLKVIITLSLDISIYPAKPV